MQIGDVLVLDYARTPIKYNLIAFTMGRQGQRLAILESEEPYHFLERYLIIPTESFEVI